MLRKTGLLSVLAFTGLAAPLHAAEHYVLLMGQGYFPQYIHPEVGDTIRFVNQAGIPMSATADDDSWDTGMMLPGAVYQLTVTDGMKQTFRNTVTSTNSNGQQVNAAPNAVGVIDYLNPAFVKLTANAEPDDAVEADYYD